KSWTSHVRSAMLHVISLAQFITVYTLNWAVDSINGRVRLKAENCRLRQECALLQEEFRIKDARMAQINPQQRPHYPPTERMAILELRAARGWTLEQAADTFLLTAPTIASWMKRVDEEGPDALVQLHEPINRYPQLRAIRSLTAQNSLCEHGRSQNRPDALPGRTSSWSDGRTVFKESPQPKSQKKAVSTGCVVTAKEPNHVWHIDLTAVPMGGFWTSWLPFALPRSWPFSWWLVVIVDHFSRRIVTIGVFANRPDCRAVCAFLGRSIRRANTAPKHIVCDRVSIFDCHAFQR
ncbi:MAG: helix-turn-helix domain-containing protein, partial [Planctomycetes bacterium]|nr:helix-turn-helix domain-containing protein [Planctomycetota bacterium]